MSLAFLGSPAMLGPVGLVALLTLALATCLALLLVGTGGGGGGGSRSTCSQALFATYLRLGRLRNLLCSSCDRCQRHYPTANTCQVPFFRSLSDVYTFVFGYKTEGLFVEVGAYDGESFSNTSGLADLGWRGHYVEPIPAYAAACAARHAGSAPRVRVHTLCIGEQDGAAVSLSAAGPFSSGVEDEIASVQASQMSSALGAMGWGHEAGAARVDAKTTALNTFFKDQGIQPGEVDVLVRGGAARRCPAPPPFFSALAPPLRTPHSHAPTLAAGH